MKVAYVGSYDPNFTRNKILREGLRQNGVDVLEYNVPFGEGRRVWSRYWQLLRRQNGHLRECDALIVPEMNQKNMPLLVNLARAYHKPLVFDPFVSLYETQVVDRGRIPRKSAAALGQFLLDRWSLRRADVVLADTHTHGSHYQEAFRLEASKLETLFVGVDESIFSPRKHHSQRGTFGVVFTGTYVPLHGVEYIVEAASLLRDRREIVFKLVGGGQTFPQVEARVRTLGLPNLCLLPLVPLQRLAEEVAEADVCLGIFGGTAKSQRVIPTKVFQALGMQKALITEDSPAIQEVFEDEKHLLVCPPKDPEGLAQRIIQLSEDPNFRASLAQGGYNLVHSEFTPSALGRRLKAILERTISGERENSHESPTG